MVLAAAELNPTGAIPAEGFEISVDGERKKIEMKTKFSQPVIHLADGTEVPARIALEDPDTGLMYVVPEQKAAKPFASMPPEPGREPGVLDELILVSRLEKQYGDEPSVSLARITSVVTKPRRGYVVGGTSGAAFDHDGRFVGVTTIRLPSLAAGAGRSSFAALPLVVPAADVAEVAAQVREQADPAGQ